MNINGPLGYLGNIFKSSQSYKSKPKAILIKGKEREKVIKAARVYSNIKTALVKDVKSYSSLKGKITITLQGSQARYKGLIKALKQNRNAIKKIDSGREKDLLLNKTKLLIKEIKSVKGHINSQKKLLSTLDNAHNIKYIKYTAQLTKVESVITSLTKNIRATKELSKSPRKERKTTKRVKRARSLNVAHLKGNDKKRLKKAHAFHTIIKESITNNTIQHNTLIGKVSAPLMADKQKLKQMTESIKSHQSTLQTIKQGTAKTYLLDKVKFLLDESKALKKVIKDKENLLQEHSATYQAAHSRLTKEIQKIDSVIRKLHKRIQTQNMSASNVKKIDKSVTQVVKKVKRLFSSIIQTLLKKNLQIGKSLKSRASLSVQAEAKLATQMKNTQMIIKRLRARGKIFF